MASDDIVYGFNRIDANELVDGLGGKERSIPGFIPQGKKLKLVRFTLTAALAASGTAAATIVSSGADNGTSITVSDHAGNAAESGDSGLAWKDGDTYWVIEIKAAADGGGGAANLVRFTLDEDIDSTSHLAGATIVSSGEDDEETIEVTDWCRNGGKEGDNGIAWRVRNPETNEDEYYIIEIKKQERVQFIQGTTSTVGDFESATADSFTLQGVVGLDRAWEGGETITVHNPLEIKVWDSDCIVKCQWNQDEDRYEVVAATQKYVMHGVRIYKFSSTCRFEKLDSTGISNWNGETFPEVTTTLPNWVTEVYVAGTAPNQTLRYKTYCMDVSNTGVQILEIGNSCP